MSQTLTGESHLRPAGQPPSARYVRTPINPPSGLTDVESFAIHDQHVSRSAARTAALYLSEHAKRLLRRFYQLDPDRRVEDDETALIVAARMNDSDLVKLLLDEAPQANVDACTDAGTTAAMFACQNGNAEIVRLLLKRGADLVHARDEDNMSAFRHLLRNNHVALMMSEGLPQVWYPEEVYEDNITPFMDAAKNCEVHHLTLKCMLARFDPDYAKLQLLKRDDHGNTALMHALKRRGGGGRCLAAVVLVEYMLQQAEPTRSELWESVVSYQNTDTYTALDLALAPSVASECPMLPVALLKLSANLVADDGMLLDLGKLLQQFVQTRNLGGIAHLIESPLLHLRRWIQCCDDRGRTCLQLAASLSFTSVLSKLLDAMDLPATRLIEEVSTTNPPNKRQRKSAKPRARSASTHRHPDPDQVILDMQEPVTGRNALMYAVHAGARDCVQVLVASGARLDLRDVDNKTAFDVAMERRCVAIAALVVTGPEDAAKLCNAISGIDKCVACMSAPITRAVLHEKTVHLCFCTECADSYSDKKCPLCRQTVERMCAVF